MHVHHHTPSRPRHPRSPLSPLGTGLGIRLAIAAAAISALWLALAWALN